MAGIGMKLERLFERVLFAMRWLLAPFFLAMAVAIAVLLIVFLRQLIDAAHHLHQLDPEGAILLGLSLIDLTLTANLLIVVMLAGYENFVSRLHTGSHEDRPQWMASVDFADLKFKVIASIVAISAISLLRVFLLLADPADHVEPARILWMVVIQMTFVLSGLLLAVADWARSRTRVSPTH